METSESNKDLWASLNEIDQWVDDLNDTTDEFSFVYAHAFMHRKPEAIPSMVWDLVRAIDEEDAEIREYAGSIFAKIFQHHSIHDCFSKEVNEVLFTAIQCLKTVLAAESEPSVVLALSKALKNAAE